MRKTVIYFNAGAYNSLKKNIEKCADDCNRIIAHYMKHQPPGGELKTFADVESLLTSPVEFYDGFVLAAVPSVQGLTARPSKIAEMYGIKRAEFLEIFGVTGDLLVESSSDLKHEADFDRYKQYLKFNAVSFTFEPNAVKMEEAKESYTQYATDEQRQQLKYLQDFVECVNHLHDCGIISNETLQSMKAFSYNWDYRKIGLPFDIHLLLGKLAQHEAKAVKSTV